MSHGGRTAVVPIVGYGTSTTLFLVRPTSRLQRKRDVLSRWPPKFLCCFQSIPQRAGDREESKVPRQMSQVIAAVQYRFFPQVKPTNQPLASQTNCNSNSSLSDTDRLPRVLCPPDGSEFERRTPRRTGNSGRYSLPSSSSPADADADGEVRATQRLTPVAAPATAPTPTPSVPRTRRRPRARTSPRPSQSRDSSPFPSGSWTLPRRDGDVLHSSPRLTTADLAGGGCSDLLWRGGGAKDDVAANTASATATALSSSLHSSSSSTGTGKSVSTSDARAARLGSSSPSDGAFGGSPVDLRGTGLGGAGEGGALGLGNPPSGLGVVLFREEREGYSPPRPRAFWREKWHEGAGGGGGGCGGGGESCGMQRYPTRSPPSLASESGPSLTAADGGAREHRHHHHEHQHPAGAVPWHCCRRSLSGASSSFLDEGRFAGKSDAGGEGSRPCRRCCGSSSSGRSLFRDSRKGVKEERSRRNSDDADARATPSPLATERTGFGVGESDDAGVRRNGEEGRGPCAGVHGGGSDHGIALCRWGETEDVGGGGRGGAGFSVAGFALLTAVAVAAFGAGTLMGPPRRQQQEHNPPPPSAAPTDYEYPTLLPSLLPSYEPTLQEMERTKRRGAKRAATASKTERPLPATAGGGDHEEKRRTERVDRVGEEEEPPPPTASRSPRAAAAEPTEESERRRDAAPAMHSSPVAAGVGDCGSEIGSAPGAAATLASPPAVAANDGVSSGREPASAGAAPSIPPQQQASRPPSPPNPSPASARAAEGAHRSEDKRPRRRRLGRAEAAAAAAAATRSHPGVSAPPAAFAETLGSAEENLAGLLSGGGGEEQAAREEDAARRASMSKRVARAAQRSLAWSNDSQDEEEGAGDAGGTAGKDEQLGGGVVGATPYLTPPATKESGSSPGEKRGEAAGKTVVESGEAAAGGGAPLVGRCRPDPDKDEERGGGSKPLPSASRCRALILSGTDLQPSWTGRYVPLRVADGGGDARQVRGAGSPSAHDAQTRDYFCLEPSGPSGPAAVAEVDARVVPEETDKPLPPSQGFLDENEQERPEREDAVPTDSPGHADAAAWDRSASYPTCSTSATVVEPNGDSGPAETPASSTVATAATVADPRLSSRVASTAAAAVAAGVEMEGELGPPEADGGGGGGVDGGLLCLYFADDEDGGRWVLDDDLRISNGVLGVTEGPAPSEADLAFPNRRWYRRLSRPAAADGASSAADIGREVSGLDLGVAGRGAWDGTDGGATGGCQDGGTNWSERQYDCQHEVASTPRPGGGGIQGGGQDGVGDETGGGVRFRVPEGPAWLLDSPRLQGWVKAEEVFVVCEAD